MNSVFYFIKHTNIKYSCGLIIIKLTNKHVSDTEQEVSGEEGDTIEREGLQASRAPRQVKYPDHHTAQAEVDGSTVHNDPVMALLK